MKENKYDDEKFFEKYSKMERSKEGLIAAGEWETLKTLLPNFKGKRVLDLGCGYGWHCIYAAQHGASSVVGADISHKMLDVAKQKTQYDNVSYICEAMEDIQFEKGSFDIVISSLAFHYIQSFEPVIKKINDFLSDGGSFIFSVEHPIFTSYGSQDWYYDTNGNILHFPVDNYFSEGKRVSNFLGESVVKYHRTLTSYLNVLLNNNFEIAQIVEPMPQSLHLAAIPEMKNELRRPMMLIVSAKKKCSV